MPQAGRKLTSDLSISRMDGCQSMMKSVLDDFRPEPRPKMWQKFDIESIVHKNVVPPGQTVNGKLYCEVLRRLKSKYPAQTSREVGQQLLGQMSRQGNCSRIARCAVFLSSTNKTPPTVPPL
jgi:hypothetical protein